MKSISKFDQIEQLYQEDDDKYDEKSLTSFRSDTKSKKDLYRKKKLEIMELKKQKDVSGKDKRLCGCDSE